MVTGAPPYNPTPDWWDLHTGERPEDDPSRVPLSGQFDKEVGWYFYDKDEPRPIITISG